MDHAKLRETVEELMKGAEHIKLSGKRIGVSVGRTVEVINPKTQDKEWIKSGASMEAEIPDSQDVFTSYNVLTAHAAVHAASIEAMQKEGKI